MSRPLTGSDGAPVTLKGASGIADGANGRLYALSNTENRVVVFEREP